MVLNIFTTQLILSGSMRRKENGEETRQNLNVYPSCDKLFVRDFLD